MTKIGTIPKRMKIALIVGKETGTFITQKLKAIRILK